MFLTHNASSKRLVSTPERPGSTAWFKVEFLANSIYLLVSFYQKSSVTGNYEERCLFLTNPSDLEDYINSTFDNNLHIQTIYALCPREMITTEEWVLHKLKTIWTAPEVENIWGKVFIFETADGGKFCQAGAGARSSHFTNLKTIYSDC